MTVRVSTAVAEGIDPEGGKWVAICEEHGAAVSTATKAAAKASSAEDFCKACRKGSTSARKRRQGVGDGAARATTPKPSADAPTASLSGAAADGSVGFYLLRASGRRRYVPFLAPGTDARQRAEWAAAEQASGRTVGAVAEEWGVSLATARRALVALALTRDVEEGRYDEAWQPGQAEVVFTRSAGQEAP